MPASLGGMGQGVGRIDPAGVGVKRKPAVRSTSSPGVRIVTATEVGAEFAG